MRRSENLKIAIETLQNERERKKLEKSLKTTAYRPNPVMPTCFHIVYGCFPSITAELINCDKNCRTDKTKKYLISGSLKKSLPILALANAINQT